MNINELKQYKEFRNELRTYLIGVFSGSIHQELDEIDYNAVTDDIITQFINAFSDNELEIVK